MPPAWFAGLLAILAGAGEVQGRGHEQSHLYDEKNGTRITFYSVFADLPPSGYAPVVVEIVNGFSEDIVWNLQFSASKDSSSFQMAEGVPAPAGASVRREIVVPMCTNYDGGSGGYLSAQLQVTASAPGLRRQSFNAYSNRAGGWPSIALSGDLATPWEGQLTKEGETRLGISYGFDFGSAFEARDLPSDWRGYTGFDAVLLTEAEWSDGRVSPGVKGALLEWVQLGGVLDIYGGAADADLGRLGLGGEAGEKEVRLGRGTLRVRGPEIDPADLIQTYSALTPERRTAAVESGFRKRPWPLQTALGIRSFNAWIIVLVLGIFGVLVGPVNLFVFARVGKRHRLFYTTPVISLGASTLLVLIILLQDRFGGLGARMALVTLDPEGRRAFVTQEQFSRTGVLLGADFPSADPLFITHVVLPPTQWTRVSGNWSDAFRFTLEQGQPSRFRGDWFFSRSEQAHFLQTVRPTRARVERLRSEGEEVVLFSSLGFPVETLFYLEPGGERWWKTEGSLETGRPARLTPSNEEAFRQWWDEVRGRGSEPMAQAMDGLRGRPGHFYAVASAALPFLVDTLPSIRWKEGAAVLTGPAPEVSGVPEEGAGNP